MKNTWLHSMVVVILAGVLLAVARFCVPPFLNVMSSIFPNPQAGFFALSAPVIAFASLVPAMVSGWFVRRHPLLVGAAAGVIATLMVNWFAPVPVGTYSLIGDASATAIYAAVAALAGRALRYRFRPGNGEIPDHGKSIRQ